MIITSMDFRGGGQTIEVGVCHYLHGLWWRGTDEEIDHYLHGLRGRGTDEEIDDVVCRLNTLFWVVHSFRFQLHTDRRTCCGEEKIKIKWLNQNKKNKYISNVFSF